MIQGPLELRLSQIYAPQRPRQTSKLKQKGGREVENPSGHSVPNTEGLSAKNELHQVVLKVWKSQVKILGP